MLHKEKTMNKNIVFFALAAFIMLGAIRADAQPAEKVHRIGILSAASEVPQFFAAFRERLRELGHVEGKNISFERRYAAGDVDRLPGFAAELVKEQVDVILAVTVPAVLAAKKATTTVPIIMYGVPDPVGIGLVESLASPGGNITGLSTLGVDLSGKRLELLKETIPKLARVAVLWNASDRGMTLMSERIQTAGQALAVGVKPLAVRDTKDVETMLAEVAKNRPDALLMITDRLTGLHLKQVLDFAVKTKLPSMFEDEVFVTEGGLMAYGANRPELNRRAAVYIDKILKGIKPCNLPVEQPMTFEFIINLKTAKQIGVTIPPNVLVRADKVIK
jgi:putative tryptophan/tyrosine transport system substrate-binding protein